jgi:hypothetical protein
MSSLSRHLPTNATPLPSALAAAGGYVRRFLRFAHSLRERASVGMTGVVTQRPRRARGRHSDRSTRSVRSGGTCRLTQRPRRAPLRAAGAKARHSDRSARRARSGGICRPTHLLRRAPLRRQAGTSGGVSTSPAAQATLDMTARPRGVVRRAAAAPPPPPAPSSQKRGRHSDRSARRARSGGTCRLTQRPCRVRKEDNRCLDFARSLHSRASLDMTGAT